MSNELNTEILKQSTTTSCFTHDLDLKGNQLLNIDNTNSFILEKPILKRGVHINEEFDLVDPKKQEEEQEEDESAKAQLQAHLLEQQQDDLVWSPFGQQLITPKDFETFEVFVEPIVQKPEQEAFNPVKKVNNLFELIISKYINKWSSQINTFLQRQSQEEEEEEEEEEEQQEDDFCESDHEDMIEEYERELNKEKEATEVDPLPITFTDFADLVDCFEAIDEEEENSKSLSNWTKNETKNEVKCSQLQENLDLLPDRLSKPTDKRFLQEWQILEQVWCEERRRIIIEHTENCEFCQSIPPKKLRRCEECNTLEPLISSSY